MKTRFKTGRELKEGIKILLVLMTFHLTSSYAQSLPQTVIQIGHSKTIQALAVSHRDNFVVTAGDDQTVIIWEAKTGRELIRLTGHQASVNAVAISPDDKYILTGGGGGDLEDYSIRLWEAASGREIRKFEGHRAPVRSLSFLAGGTKFLSASGSFGGEDNSLRLWDLKTGKELMSPVTQAAEINTIALSPDGNLVALGCGGIETDSQSVTLWDLSAGKQIGDLKGHEQWITSLAFSPDGKLLLSGGADNTARLWEVATGKPVHVFRDFENWVTSLAFSPGGDLILVGSADNKARLWNLKTKELIKTYSYHTSTISAAAFSPDGKSVLLASLHGLASRQPITRTGAESPPIFYRKLVRSVETVNFSEFDAPYSWPNFLLAGEDGIIKLWSLEDGKEIKRFDFGKTTTVTSTAFTPLGKGEEASSRLVAANSSGDACLWDLTSGAQIRCFEGHSSPIWSLALSSDGKSLLTAGGLIGVDNSARLWDIETGKQKLLLEGHANGLLAVVFSNNGKLAATGSMDGSARIWDLENGRVIHELPHDNYVSTVVFSPADDLLVSGDIDGTLSFWKVSDGSLSKKIKAHRGLVSSLRFIATGKKLLSAGEDGSINEWNTENKQLIKKVIENGSAVKSLAVSSDGRFLLSGGTNGAGRLFDLAETKEVARLVSFSDGGWTVFTSDGRFDTDDLERDAGLHYFIPEEPFKGFPITHFARDYFEPRLLTRLLAKDKLPEIKNPGQLNRALPEVAIKKLSVIEGQPNAVKVSVEVKSTTSGSQFEANGKPFQSEAFGLKLFRNGQLVATVPKIDSTGSAAEKELESWRRQNKLPLDLNGTGTFEFTVNLPRVLSGAEVKFSAYSFNSDRIKSETATINYINPHVSGAVKGRAFVISIGVNATDSPGHDLRFAVNDAKQINKTIPAGLKALGSYSEVIDLELISEREVTAGLHRVNPKTATKEIIKGVFDLLAGREISPELKSRIPKSELLRAVTPDDLVLITYSGHGVVEPQGEFYLIPADARVDLKATETFISSNELADWLRPIDAGEIALVIDACYSAASVEGDGFKPAPMGARGLGQLAYDKGIRILTASQADKVALEAGKNSSGESIQQGLLTFALTREGIENRAADRLQTGRLFLRNWFNYGAERVPQLYSEIRGGRKGVLIDGQPVEDVKARSELIDLGGARKQGRQRPVIFDFRSGNRSDILLWKW